MQIDIDLDRQISDLTDRFEDAPRKVELALKRTLRDVSRFAEKQVLRILANEAGVTQRLIKQLDRVKVSLREPGSRGLDRWRLVVWVGLNDISAHYLGKPVQTTSGVRTGRWQWPGAFVFQPANTTRNLVFKRSPNARQRKQRSRKSGWVMWMALPVEKVGLPIEQQAHEAIARIESDILNHFQVVMQRQLNFAFNIEGTA